MSRSASFVIAYIMKEKNLKYNKAFELVKARRPVICVNPGFYNQLRCYEIKLCVSKDDEIDEVTKNYQYSIKVEATDYSIFFK